ncbi:dynamin family protein [Ruegeria arenilitoris]|uniref:GTPase Era n=1 Tax=Ruegeria arenilitoris TaxID=1173585 RepID=A0A238KCT7_9RHOB|nr:dynamin family protein [Ruegeria arenilitoris]SMX40619.1 GTPase Era [Ruegeria arenilitoris]
MAKDSQIRFVSPRAWERIEQWSRRKPVFALMGEFSAGKSTLMNFLLRKQALPTQVTATQLPPVWFSWGNKPAYVQRHDGTTSPIGLDELDKVGVNDAQFIRIYLEADILEAVDLIDTPGISDPKIQADVWRRAVGQANGVLWCTHSTQAWRETERATWVSLPERLQHNSLLLVTRADALDLKDRQKVLRRINREAGHLFNRTILFSARDAIIARDKTGDAELWSRSGGGKMIDSFLEITEQIMDSRAEKLARYQIDKSLAGTPPVQPVRPERSDRQTAAEEPAPFKLTNPLDQDDGFEAVRNSDDVIATFPVRPARVERRGESTERERINPDDADRLRAEMSPVPDDDLRALFRDEDEDRLSVAATSKAVTQLDDEDFDEIDVEDDEILVADSDDQTTGQGAQDEDLLATLSERLVGETPAPVTDEQDETPGPSVEDSVSSIASLLSQQQGDDATTYEPEPESNGLVAAQTPEEREAEAPCEQVGEGETSLEHLLSVPAGAPLSAAAMWREIAASEDIPQDVDGLHAVFQAFLEEFDKIAHEHTGRDEQDTIQPVPNPKDRAEWHVL